MATLSFETCKAIAEKKAADYGFTLNQAYSLKNDFVFGNKEEDCPGIFPVVVNRKSGDCTALWTYLNKFDLSMDDMEEINYG